MKTHTDTPAHDLDDLFAEARAAVPLNSDLLQGRVFADALQHQPKLAKPLAKTPARLGFWRNLAAGLGGPGVLAGLGTAAVAGAMIGFVQPPSLSAFTDTFFAAAPLDDLDLLPGVDAILTEG